MKKLNLRHSSGQVLVMVALALPVFFGFTALVVDGSTLMVHKRSSQNAVDAVALAMSQNIQITGGGGTCNNCQAVGLDYIQRNGIDPASLSPAWHQCNDPDHANPTDQNCFAYPYYKASDPLTPRYGQVEVRLTTSSLGDLRGCDRPRRAVQGLRALGGECESTDVGHAAHDEH